LVSFKLNFPFFAGLGDDDDELEASVTDNEFYHYFDHYHYLDHSQVLNFTISPRRRHGRSRQYEIIQKMLNETLFAIAKIYLSIISIRNNSR
jgi:ABC-type Zn2+ transport system substrate-binding protein/surface adhesin